LPACIEIALAPALGIGLKQYFGLTHPPAGAAAIVFSALDYGWIHFILFELGVIIVIICSMIINNLNDHRQYPTYWYLNPRGRREDDRSQ
jgi:CBS-domain-containing membrane protein